MKGSSVWPVNLATFFTCLTSRKAKHARYYLLTADVDDTDASAAVNIRLFHNCDAGRIEH